MVYNTKIKELEEENAKTKRIIKSTNQRTSLTKNTLRNKAYTYNYERNFPEKQRAKKTNYTIRFEQYEKPKL